MNSNKMLRYLILIILVIVVVSISIHAEESQTSHVDGLDCDKCHTCATPTARNVCLKPCFRHTALTESGDHQLSDAPDSVLLDELTGFYEPITFDHKHHAEMAGMSDNCNTCHHYSPEGEIPSCRSCHPKELSANNLAQPDLKTAYHRQCLVCHSQWAHEATCDICHQEPKAGHAMSQNVMSSSAPPAAIMVPIIASYVTSYEPAPVVTFQHIEHIELFEYECVDCHQHENCQNCHDQINGDNISKSIDQVHKICSNCHDIGSNQTSTEGCSECHNKEVQKPLFHAIVGKTLPQYLQKVGCEGCHPENIQESR